MDSKSRQLDTMDKEARKLADGLRNTFRWVDNFGVQKKELTGMNLPHALVSYMGVKIAQDAGVLQGVLDVRAARPSHRCLMGILRPGATIQQLALFPLTLHRTALLLGAIDGELVESRNTLWEGVPAVPPANYTTPDPRIVTLMWSAIGETTP